MDSWRGASRWGSGVARASSARTVAFVFVVSLAFLAGRLSAPAPDGGIEGSERAGVALRSIDLQVGNVQGADPRELIPLPGRPGGTPDQNPGESPGQGEAQCPYYFYRDGEFFEMQPGGPADQGPRGEGQPELFPLDPVPSPEAPGSPTPDSPAPDSPGSPSDEPHPSPQPRPDPPPVVPGQPRQVSVPEVVRTSQAGGPPDLQKYDRVSSNWSSQLRPR